MILAYCITADPDVTAPANGVRNNPVQEIADGDLRCFFSRFENRPEKFTKEDALRFYATVEEVFAQAAVVPFRFPTVVKSEAELRRFLVEKSQPYSAALRKVRNSVQMELRIATATNVLSEKKSSGKQYMSQRLRKRQLLESVAKAARVAAGDLAGDWREREAPEGARCYALVDRENVDAFRAAMKTVPSHTEVKILVSGPWPAAEFIE